MTCDPHGDDWPALRRMGAWGFVSKTLPLDPFSQTFVEAATRENRADDGDKALKHLSPSSRQLDLLHAMARGGNRHRIAAELHLTPPWIDDLIHELKKKLGDGNWAYLVLRAIEEGWIEPRVPPPESIPTSPLRPSPAPAHL